MHDHPCGFVDDDDVSILVENGQRDGLGLGLSGDGRGYHHFDRLTLMTDPRGTRRLASDPDATRVDPAFHLRAAGILEVTRNDDIQSQISLGVVDLPGFGTFVTGIPGALGAHAARFCG